MRQYTLSEIGLPIYSGQIMTRITKKEDAGDNDFSREIKVIIPKCINADGTIDTNEIVTETIFMEPDPRRITEVGDIVIKLSTPYDAAIITEESSGCLVPSFCALIKDNHYLERYYLLGFLNSEECKRQIRKQVAGATVPLVSIGKIANIIIPVPEPDEIGKIGREYKETQEKLSMLRKMTTLLTQRNDAVFRELVSSNE